MLDILTISGYALAGVLILIGRFGGAQIVYYRIRKISYFIDYIRGPDKRYRRRLATIDKIEKSTPASWHYGLGNYFLPENEAAISEHGANMWFHAWDEARAIPQYMDTIEEFDKESGKIVTKTVFRDKIPPALIRAGLRSKVAAEMHPVAEEKQNKLAWYIVPMLLLILVGVLATALYAHDVACAVHARTC